MVIWLPLKQWNGPEIPKHRDWESEDNPVSREARTWMLVAQGKTVQSSLHLVFLLRAFQV